MKDLELRKEVMDRAAQIGHCVCDRTKTCPCNYVQECDVCICAGESLEDAGVVETKGAT